MEEERKTFLIACKIANIEDCKVKIDEISKRFKDNIVAVYETVPFSNPNRITANISGDTNFIVEAVGTHRVGINQLKDEFETQIKSNISKPIVVY